MGLLIGAALGLLIAGVFQFIFYLNILPATWSVLLRTCLATGLAVFFEILAFFFLVATVRDFSAGAKREGWIGVSASLLLLSYCGWEAIHIASVFDNNTEEGFWSICSILGTIILAVRVVELRITLTVSSAYKKADSDKSAQALISELQSKLESKSIKLQAYLDAEEEAEQNRVLAAQVREAEATAKREEEVRAAMKELEKLRKQLSASEENQKPTRNTKGLRSEIIEAAFRHYNPNTQKLSVTREVIASLCNTTTRTISSHFPNGTLETVLKEEFHNRNKEAFSEERL